MTAASLVTRDPATGLRCTPTFWTQTGTIPTPDGCRWCGHERRSHGQLWKPSVGFHKWAEPTDAQRLARMKARRAARIAAKQPKPIRPELLVEISVEDTLTPAIKGVRDAIDFHLWDREMEARDA